MKITTENIVPLKNFLLIDASSSRPTETSSGFVLPEERYSPTPVLGTVIAAGPQATIKVGQTVLFRRFSIDEMKFNTDGTQQVISLLSEDEIVGVIKENA